MTSELDRTQQRIVGVLIEKELTVPDTYPLTENALMAGCNQKSNRDPEMDLEQFELIGAVNALLTAEWLKTTTSQGGHKTRYAHRLEDQYAVDEREKAVLCELLVRGPQAPGALKSRVARLGVKSDASGIEELLRGLAARPKPLVEQLSRRPRERDNRWRHCLGATDAGHEAQSAASEGAPGLAALPTTAVPAVPAGPRPAPPAMDASPDLGDRVAKLEAEVASLREELARFRDA